MQGDNTQDIFNFIKSIKSNYPEDVKYDSVINPFNYDKGLKDIDIKIMNLFYYSSMSIKDIAKKLNISELNVKTRLHRIRKKIKKELNNGGI